MKKSLSLIASFFLVAVLLVSCDKDVDTSPVTVDKSKTAIVKGYLYADLNLTTAGLEPAPANIKVLVTVSNNDLISGATGNWIDTVKTDANGTFSISVPVVSQGVTVSIKAADFIADQTQPLTSHYAANAIKKVFSTSGATTLTVLPGEENIQIVDYDKVENFSNFVEVVTVKGKAYAELDGTMGNENANIIDVIFSADGWSKKVTLTKEGVYTVFNVDVPKGEIVSYTFDFTASKGGKTYRYKGTEILGAYGVDTENLAIDFGAGEEVQ